MNEISLVNYDESFLALSWEWLNDKDVKALTLTPDFTKEQQTVFFNNLKLRKDYRAYGLLFEGEHKIGAVGLKNIKEDKAEYWGYIGDKNYWNKGLGSKIIKQIEGICLDNGIWLLYLNVSTGNLRAVKSYLKSGFKIKKYRRDTIYMEKVINADAFTGN